MEKSRKELEEVVESNFPERYFPLEVLLSVKIQNKIQGITQPFALILLGDPSSYKSTLLYLVNSLPECYRSDSFTPKSFVSHSANVSKKQLEEIDLLPKIKDKTLITPELAPIFSGKDEKQIEMFGILTRILDGKGFQSDSGVHGSRGYVGDYYFNWLGAVVEIPHRVWKILGNLGPKMYFLRLRPNNTSEEQKQQEIISNLTGKQYNSKLDETKDALCAFWKIIEDYPNQNENKIVWDSEKDDKETLQKITVIAQVLARLRASVPTWHNGHADNLTEDSEYNFEAPIIEEPTRAAHALYNLAKGHAVLYGRNHITDDDLKPIIAVALSSASRERVELFRLLIETNGSMNTNEFVEKAKVSRDTALKNMGQLRIIGLVEKTEQSTSTKPITVIKLLKTYDWFLSAEFKIMWSSLYHKHIG